MAGRRRAGERRPTSDRVSVVSIIDRHRSNAIGRADATRWAAEVAGDFLTVYLDTETTGLGKDAEVIDIAVVAGDGRVLLDTLVRPMQPIPPDASRVNGIWDADVAAAPHWHEVHDALVPLLEARRIVVYNAAFDRRLLSQTCARHGLLEPQALWDCAMLEYARYCGELNASQRGYRWHRLDHAALSFGAQPGGHRALGDALACRHVVLGMATSRDE